MNAVSEARKGMDRGELLNRLAREDAERVDIVAPTTSLRMEPIIRDGAGWPALMLYGEGRLGGLAREEMPLTDHAHRQLASTTGIPWAYYQRAREESLGLLSFNVNHWFQHAPKNRLVRTVRRAATGDEVGPRPHEVRALLSDRYKVLDNRQFLKAALEAAAPFRAEVKYCHMDTDRLHVQLTTPLERELPSRRGDILKLGLSLRNSEVGDGRVLVQPWLLRLVCTNGMTAPAVYKRTHLGSQMEVGVQSPETLRLEAEAIMSHIGDWVRHALDPDNFEQLMEQLDAAAGTPILGKPTLAVANVVKQHGLTQKEGWDVLEAFLGSGDATQYDLTQCVTRVAQESDSFRRAVELEDAGGQLVTMRGDRFQRLTQRRISDKELAKLLGPVPSVN